MVSHAELERRVAEHAVWVSSFGAAGSRFVLAADEELDFAKAIPSFRGLDLRRADLRGAFLPSVDFTDANLAGADLSSAYLRRATLSGADLTGALLHGAVLREAVAVRAVFAMANLTRAVLLNACVGDSVFREASLVRANLRNATFGGADLTDADLTDAHCRCADIVRIGAKVHGDRYRPQQIPRGVRAMNQAFRYRGHLSRAAERAAVAASHRHSKQISLAITIIVVAATLMVAVWAAVMFVVTLPRRP